MATPQNIKNSNSNEKLPKVNALLFKKQMKVSKTNQLSLEATSLI